MKYDEWQIRVKETKGNIVICSGRQAGKSTIISEDAGDYAMANPNKSIMIIASVERQALLLFEKVLSYIYTKNKSLIGKKKDKPTKHELKLKNGSIIRCLPTGDSGYGIRGYTIDRLYADEAAFIKEEVWAAVTPMLTTTGGDIVLLSTPFGTTGYFYRCFHDKKFTAIHVNTREVAEKRDEPMRSRMMDFLDDEETRMTKLQFKQEYLGEFVGGIQRYFPDDLIESICTLDPELQLAIFDYDHFTGVDVARMGGDETVILEMDRDKNRDKLYMRGLCIPEAQKLTDTARLIIHKDKAKPNKKIYIDDGGLGAGVYDMLFEDRQTKRKVVAINNAKRAYEIDSRGMELKEKTKPLLKEQLYQNLKNLMEKGKIELFDDPRVIQSLRSIQYDNQEGTLRIYGNYSHIVEALIRASWCIKDKALNIYVY